MAKKCLAIFMAIITLLCLSACSNKNDMKINYNANSSNTNDKSLETNDDYNIHGNFQSSLLNMSIEGEWIFYSNYYDFRDGIKRTLVNGGEYSKYNVETVFNPNEHMGEMVAKLRWNNSDFYEIEDIISINNLQVVNNWVYWASDCAIWRFPTLVDADILDLELVAVIGVPERPTSTNFYVDGEWIYYACNAIKEQYDLSTALIEHSLYKQNLKTNEIVLLDSATSTEETLGDVAALGYASESHYNKLVSLKTVCEDGRIYYSNYEKDNVLCFKDGIITETSLMAYTYCRNSYKKVATNLFASRNGNIFSMIKDCIVTEYGHSDDINYFYYQPSDFKLTDGEEIEEFSFITDDGWYYASYDKQDGTLSSDYEGLFKIYFNSENSKKITNDKLKSSYPEICSACICGNYLYYYTSNETLCRTRVDGGSWEDVSWMIN